MTLLVPCSRAKSCSRNAASFDARPEGAALYAGEPLPFDLESLGYTTALETQDPVHVARDLLGVEFPGGLGRNDWRRRPLPEAWIEYAANDVIALPRMRELS